MKSKHAILLINYGTPDAPDKKSIRAYLRSMLDNYKVISLPKFPRKLLVNCIIAPFRAGKSLKLYKMMPFDGKMPLLKFTEQLAQTLNQRFNGDADVFFAMTAGNPSVKSAVEKICSLQYNKLTVLPMFPHYTESSVGAALSSFYSAMSSQINLPQVNVVTRFCENENYINALNSLIYKTIKDVEFDKLIFSFHGIPELHTQWAHPSHRCDQLDCEHQLTDENRFCYRAQCYFTARQAAKILSISPDKIFVSFQSRFADKWLEPSTEESVMDFLLRENKKIVVVTPSFTADCLETYVEIAFQLKNRFLNAGGLRFECVPCLNVDPLWVDAMYNMLKEYL